MRHGRGKRGLSLLELLTASTIATVVGGAILLLTNAMRDVYQTHTTFNQLAGYLDTATTILRQDIWGATNATPTVGSGVCPDDWLRLTNTQAATPTEVAYCIDATTDPNNKTLRRTRIAPAGPAWNVAQYIVQENTTAQPDVPNTPQDALITTNIQVARTVNGREYRRQVNDMVYRMQSK